MSEKTTSGTDKPPPPIPCPICGALDHAAGFHDNQPAGFHDNSIEKSGTTAASAS